MGKLREIIKIQPKKHKKELTAQNNIIEQQTHNYNLLKDIKSSIPAVSDELSKILPRHFIEHLDFHLVDHCNLNCKCCSTYAPIAKEHYADVKSFEKDLKKLHDLIGDSVSQIHLLGGEPLLHPRLEDFIRIARKIFSQARIDVTTNGILVFKMPSSLWRTMTECNVALKYTQYPINLDYNKMVEYVKGFGVYVFSAGGKDPIKYFRRIPLKASGVNNAWKSYIHCAYTDCATLRDGKLFHCPIPVFYQLFNECMKKEAMNGRFQLSSLDYVDLYQVSTKEDVMKFMSNAQPFCQYCDMKCSTNVIWEQSSRKIQEWVDE